jgi:uncharacterized protein YbjT (DUF2867 family)
MDGPVLVTGATGYIGGGLIEELLARKIQVRAMSRNPERLAALGRHGVDVVQGDVLDRASLRNALDGVSAAYYLVHSMGSEATFADYDRYAAQNFAREGGHLEQVIYLGGLGRPGDDLSPHLRSRLEVGEILLSGRAPTTVLRAGIVIGRDSASFIMLSSLIKRLPVMVCPRWVLTRTQPIAIRDTLAYLGGSLGRMDTTGRDWEIGGPDVMTYREMMLRTATVLGRHPRIVTVPVLTPNLSAYWVDLVTPVPMAMAHALIEGLRNEAVVHDDSLRALIPIELTPFDAAVREAIR